MILEIRVQRLSHWDSEEHVRLVETQDMSKIMGELTRTAKRYAKVHSGHWRATAWSSIRYAGRKRERLSGHPR